MAKKVSKQQAIDRLWRMGNLEWKLRGKQKDIKTYLKENPEDVSVILCSRRFGKSYILCCWAIEECIKTPRAIVKYACPEKIMVSENINPNIETILEDCPKDLKPEWKEAKKAWIFPNGSMIQLAGTDKGHVEKLRGGYSHLCICDEAGFMTDLEYVVNSVMAPTTDTTNGKIVLASTPNYKDPNHEFHTEFIFPRQATDNLAKFTVYESPMVDEKRLQRIISRYPQGIEDPRFKCEYLCEIAASSDYLVIPEFNDELKKDVVQYLDEVPPHYDAYVSGDPAVTDLTGLLFAYFDYMNHRLVILDEIVMGGEGFEDLTTDDIASAVIRKEKLLFTCKLTGETKKPYLRIMDNNNKILINDLAIEHGLEFVPTKKDNKEAQINKLRMMLKKGQIVIHPRCKNLLFHLSSAQWNKRKDGFLRVRALNKDNLRSHHCDLLDALIYMVRNIDFNHNPYPEDYFTNFGPNYHHPEREENQQLKSFFGKLLNKKIK